MAAKMVMVMPLAGGWAVEQEMMAEGMEAGMVVVVVVEGKEGVAMMVVQLGWVELGLAGQAGDSGAVGWDWVEQGRL